jgi:hypothetical protein
MNASQRAFLILFLLALPARIARADDDPSREGPLAPLPAPSANDSGPLVVTRLPAPKPSHDPPRLELTGQVGLALPMGKVSAAEAGLGQVVSPQVPIGLEVGPRLTRHLFIGAYGSVAFGTAAGDFHTRCATGANTLGCSVATIRFGIATRLRFRPDTSFMPWVGYGLGVESTSMDLFAASGIDFAHISVGADLRAREDAVFGPVIDFGLGHYTDERTNVDSGSASVDKQALHGWLTLGIRGTYSL